MRVTIAIPAYDEIESLSATIAEAIGLREGLPGREIAILVVDDGSRDGTSALADDLASQHAAVRVVHHERNRGFSGAMLTCFREATGDFLFLAAADGQTPLPELRRFLSLADQADIVVGVRVSRPEGPYRKLLSLGFHALSRWLYGLPEREFSSAFLFRQALLDVLPLRSIPRSATLLPEVLYRARSRGARIVEVDVQQRPRRAGRAKGGQLSVAAVTLLELIRIALVARWEERRTTPFIARSQGKGDGP